MKLNRQCEIKEYLLKADGGFPNNPRLPLLIYKSVLEPSSEDLAGEIESLFERHGWGGSWRDSVYPFHHYHSNTHEVLGCYRGSATIQFGGPNGPVVPFVAGDVAVLPAGTSHKKLDASHDFAVVGAYPAAADYDLLKGDPADRPQAEVNIRATPIPDADPVFGSDGGLRQHWQG